MGSLPCHCLGFGAEPYGFPRAEPSSPARAASFAVCPDWCRRGGLPRCTRSHWHGADLCGVGVAHVQRALLDDLAQGPAPLLLPPCLLLGPGMNHRQPRILAVLGPVGGSFSTSRNLSGTEQSWEAPPICSLEREALGFLAHYLFRGFSALQQSASMNTDWRNTLPFPPGSGLPGALQAVRGKRGQVGEDARRGGCLKLGRLQASLSSEQRTPGVEADFWGVCEDPLLGQLPGGMAPGSLCVWRSPEVLWTQEGVHSRCRESGSPAWHVAATLTQTVLELTGPQMSHWGSKKMDFGGRTLEACFSGLGFAPLSPLPPHL